MSAPAGLTVTGCLSCGAPSCERGDHNDVSMCRTVTFTGCPSCGAPSWERGEWGNRSARAPPGQPVSCCRCRATPGHAPAQSQDLLRQPQRPRPLWTPLSCVFLAGPSTHLSCSSYLHSHNLCSYHGFPHSLLPLRPNEEHTLTSMHRRFKYLLCSKKKMRAICDRMRQEWFCPGFARQNIEPARPDANLIWQIQKRPFMELNPGIFQ